MSEGVGRARRCKVGELPARVDRHLGRGRQRRQGHGRARLDAAPRGGRRHDVHACPAAGERRRPAAGRTASRLDIATAGDPDDVDDLNFADLGLDDADGEDRAGCHVEHFLVEMLVKAARARQAASGSLPI